MLIEARPTIDSPVAFTLISGSVTFLSKIAPVSIAMPTMLEQSARLGVNSISNKISSKSYA